jgi:hypothetical protein
MCSIMRLFFWENGTSIFDNSVDSVVLMALFSDRSRRDASDIDRFSREAEMSGSE